MKKETLITSYFFFFLEYIRTIVKNHEGYKSCLFYPLDIGNPKMYIKASRRNTSSCSHFFIDLFYIFVTKEKFCALVFVLALGSKGFVMLFFSPD